jgi:hypothetical protein
MYVVSDFLRERQHSGHGSLPLVLGVMAVFLWCLGSSPAFINNLERLRRRGQQGPCFIHANELHNCSGDFSAIP